MKGKLLLIVENDVTFRENIETRYRRRFEKVEVAKNPEEAVRIVDHIHLNGGTITLAVIDLCMPHEGLSLQNPEAGFDVVEHIRSLKWPREWEPKIVVQTQYANEERRPQEQSLEYGDRADRLNASFVDRDSKGWDELDRIKANAINEELSLG